MKGLSQYLPAISTCLLGVLAGHWLRSGKYTPNRKALGLAVAGVASLFVAWVWSFNFPIIKNIWSSTFVLWAGGWSMLLLALFYWIIDVRGYQRWAFYFKVIGMNSITIYLVDRFFDFGIITKVFLHGLHARFWPAISPSSGAVRDLHRVAVPVFSLSAEDLPAGVTNDRDGVTRTPDFGVRGSSLATSTTRRRKRLPPRAAHVKLRKNRRPQTQRSALRSLSAENFSCAYDERS